MDFNVSFGGLVKSLVLASMVGLFAVIAQAQQPLELSKGRMMVQFGETSLARKRVEMTSAKLRVGSKVITRANYEATVVSLIAGPQGIKVRYKDGTITEVKLKDLGATEGCNGAFCVGEDVITRSGYRAKAVALFTDGAVTVQYWDNSLSNKNLKDVAVTNACNTNLCTGDKAIISRNNVVSVVGFFSDGKIAVEYYDGSIRDVDESSLSRIK